MMAVWRPCLQYSFQLIFYRVFKHLAPKEACGVIVEGITPGTVFPGSLIIVEYVKPSIAVVRCDRILDAWSPELLLSGVTEYLMLVASCCQV